MGELADKEPLPYDGRCPHGKLNREFCVGCHPRPPHPVSREDRAGTYCEDYELDGCSVDVCPEGCWQALGGVR